MTPSSTVARRTILLLSAWLSSTAAALIPHDTRAQEHAPAPVLPAAAAYRFFTFTFENDLFVGEDDGFTNGMGFTFGHGPFPRFDEDSIPRWLVPIVRRTYVSRGDDKRRGVSHSLFQRMQTPRDITLEEPEPGDLPYAGVLGWRGTFIAYDENQSDQLALNIGVVGPASLAEQAQSVIHTVTGSDKPEGWDTQLKNELVFGLQARRIHKIARGKGEGRSWDVLALANGSLGTLQSGLGAGLAFRWGSNLDYTHSTFSLEADRQVNALAVRDSNGFYTYIGVRSGVIFNDVMVDGNTFTESRSAPLEHYQDQLSAGVVWSMGSLAYVFQFSSFTSPVETIDDREKYGALSVTFSY